MPTPRFSNTVRQVREHPAGGLSPADGLLHGVVVGFGTGLTWTVHVPAAGGSITAEAVIDAGLKIGDAVLVQRQGTGWILVGIDG